MRAFTELFAILFIGLSLGGALAWVSIQNNHGFGALSVGQWTAWPKAGSIGADPYSKAKVAADGDVPLGAAEGLTFHARTDNREEALLRQCRYVIRGKTPQARLWTLTAQDENDQLIINDDGRPSSLVSRNLLRNPNGVFEIHVGSAITSENWLEMTGTGPFMLLLRLYDSPVTSTGEIDSTEMPVIIREACPS